jgi:hypothetical protein
MMLKITTTLVLVALLFAFGCAATAPDPPPTVPIEIDFILTGCEEIDDDWNQIKILKCVFEIRHNGKVEGRSEFYIDLSNAKLSDTDTK